MCYNGDGADNQVCCYPAMTINVLIVDPDIAFTVPIKRALEISGDYKVDVFASGRPALEVLERDPHDVAILDFALTDIPLTELIEAMRRIQPWIFILVSPRTPEEIDQAPNLDIQGSITKPYFARQLGPVIREAALARARLANRTLESPTPPESAGPDNDAETPVARTFRPDDTYRMVMADFNAADAPAVPDDAVVRDVVAGLPGNETADTTQRNAAPEVAPPPPPSTLPEPPPEPARDPARDAALVAEMALEVADDATVPLDGLPKALAERVETLPPEDRPPLPPWIPADRPDEPTLVGDAYPTEHLHGPSFVASIPAEPVFAPAPERGLPVTPAQPEPAPAAPEPAQPEVSQPQTVPPLTPAPAAPTPTPEPEETIPLHEPIKAPPPAPVENHDLEEHELSLTFAGLLPADERPVETVFGPESTPSAPPAPASPAAPSRPPRAFRPQGPDAVASLALQLTQLSVESAAQFTLLSRTGGIVAMAGSLSEQDTQALLGEIAHIWEGEEGGAAAASVATPTSAARPARFRYMQLPSGGDFLLYSARTVETMALTMLFPGDVPLKLIRKQAAQLLDLLERVPESALPAASEPETATESEAARTQPSRPTDLRAPEGFREAVDALAADQGAPAAPAQLAAETALASYTFVWLPRKDELPAETVDLLSGWLNEVAAGHDWPLDSAQVQPTFVAVQMRLPGEVGPSVALDVLMRETAAHAGDAGLWADASYIVTPAREISDLEIAGLIEFRRESQGAADQAQ
ncbi:MAG: response regulator [Anaerolineae bacterium]|nr:response regulator [Anaerolineae bacterium]